MRDVLVNRVPRVMRREIFASAALLGAIALERLDDCAVPQPASALPASGDVLALRLAALTWQLHLTVLPPRGE